MDSMIELPSGWMTTWLNRTNAILSYSSAAIYITLSVTTLVLSIRSLQNLLQTRRNLLENPSSRAAIFAECNKTVHVLSRRQFYIGTTFVVLGISIWIVDAGVCFSILRNDTSEASSVAWDQDHYLESSIFVVEMFAMLIATIIIFPLLQAFLGLKLLSKSHRRRGADPAATLSDYFPGARILSTYLGQSWAMLAFVVMAYWPIFENSTLRVLIGGAFFASAYMWLHVSYAMNFHVERLEGIEVREMLSCRLAARKYGRGLFGEGEKAQGGLPQYEPVAQIEPSLDEKAGA